MKKLLFIFLIIFSSQSFAKSPVGKVLFCDSFRFEFVFGLFFLEEDSVEHIEVDFSTLEFDVFVSGYFTTDTSIFLNYRDYIIDRKTLKYKDGLQCYLKNSKEELLDHMTNLIEKGKQKRLEEKQKILDENQI